MNIRAAQQLKLVDSPFVLPNGLVYEPNFISPDEEAFLLEHVEKYELTQAPYFEYTARRRIRYFEPLPPFLDPLAWRIAKRLGISQERVSNALLTEYSPGTPLGWHRDKESCEHIVGISLAGWCRLRFRPLPSTDQKKLLTPETKVEVEAEPRSLYIMQHEARVNWQHSVMPVKALRYSLTFLRTRVNRIPSGF